MQVENIECQIAQAQIGHFLTGSGLSEEAIKQLEEHIGACPDCKAVLNERRSELRAMLTGEKAIVDFEKIAREATGTQPKSIATALRKQSLQQLLSTPAPAPAVETKVEPVAALPVEEISPAAEVPESPTPVAAKAQASKWKPLGYSLALALVLVGMSLFSNNIANIFGPKANETLVASNAQLVDHAPAPDLIPQPESTPPAAEKPVNPNPTASTSNGTPVTEAPPEEIEFMSPSVAGTSLGVSCGALATTQFVVEETVAQTPVPRPITPVRKVSTPVRRTVNRRVTRRQPVRRPFVRKAASKPRGIKVYNP
ncbi:MAG TPA: hypothetical protein VJ835_00315 [Fimbriimonadaceae bacterium]|nr:hypothetical protein [Fimbriimonadaceae bacterium]